MRLPPQLKQILHAYSNDAQSVVMLFARHGFFTYVYDDDDVDDDNSHAGYARKIAV